MNNGERIRNGKEKCSMNEQMQNISFLSLNVRGIRDRLKRSKIFSWINHQKSDIVMLQETFLTSDLEIVIKTEHDFYCFFNHGTNHSKGVATFIRKKKFVEPLEHFVHFNGRAVAVRLIYNECTYFILNVYAPTKRNEKEQFFVKLSKWLKKLTTANDFLILGGDWNCVQDASLDTRGMTTGYKQVIQFKKLIQRFHLLDAWRKFFPFRKQYTWRQLRMSVFSRLDYWLISDVLLPYVQSTDIKPISICDHCAITIKFSTRTPLRGSGVWKLNNSLLKDDEYKEKIKNIIRKFKLENAHMNAQVKWDMCKTKVKEFTIKYSKHQQIKRNKTFKQLQDEFEKVSKETDENSSEENIKHYEKIKKEIDKFMTYNSKGAFIRSRQKWLEHGEKSSKYFLQIEKRNGKKKCIDCIKKNGKFIRNQENILVEITNYYKDLYSEKNNVNTYEREVYLESLEFPTLSEEEAILCEGLITEEECRNAIFSMKNNKSPGSDGLSSEFYKCFWDDIKTLVVDSANYGFEKQELSESQKLAILTLLYKKGDKQCLDNWRPISLLNTDYKIIAKILCTRLKRVVNKLISYGQTGYLKQRSAMQNLRLVQDIIDYCEQNDIQGILLFLDFKKAFDCVDHNFLFHALRLFNFKETFIGWVKTLYTNAVGSVVNNGWTSHKFEIKQGIRQGCPLSALLFILVAEIMALKVKQNNDIHGIEVHHNNSNEKKEFKISQLADDTAIFVNSVHSANVALKEVKRFGIFAGPSLNMMKTKVITIKPQEESVDELEYSDEPIKYLGIYLSRNNNESEYLNWSLKLEKVKSILKFWKMRNLTYFGKVVVIKSLIVSQFVYVTSVLPYPKNIIPTLSRLIHQFLWNSKREKIKRSALLNNVENGGLKMIDVEIKFQSVYLSWLTNFLNSNNDAPWRFMFRYWIEKIGPTSLIFKTNCSSKDMLLMCQKRKLPNFYTRCLLCWSELRYVDFLQVENVKCEILWFNSNIRANGKMLFFDEWYKKGILSVDDILENGSFKFRNHICNVLDQNSLLVDFKYAKLKNAIPKVWVERTRIGDNPQNFDNDLYEIKTHDIINLSKMKSRNFYTILCDLKKSDPCVLAFWEEKFNLGIDFNWREILRFKFKILKNNKVKQCYFKTLHRILPYRYNLCKWNIINNDTCEFCLQTESFVHVILECPVVSLFWARIVHYVHSYFDERLLLNEKLLLIGSGTHKNSRNIDVILAYAQYAIYKTYMLNYFQGKVFNSFKIWNTLKQELIYDNVSHEISNSLKMYVP